MLTNFWIRRWARAFCTIVVAIVFQLGCGIAQARIWSGLAGDGNWNTSGNWDSAVVPGDFLSFGFSNPPLVLNNNLTPDISITGITFDSGALAFTFNGNRITVGDDLNDDEVINAQIINLPIVLGISPAVNVVSGGSLTLAGVVSGQAGA